METIGDYNRTTTGEVKPKQTYFWAYAIYQGKLLIDGVYRTESDAYTFAAKHIPVRFEVVELNTRNEARATQEIKHITLEQTEDLDFSIQRARHKVD